MVGNRETVDHLLALLEDRRLRGKVVLHCNRGRIEDIEIRERVQPPWKAREDERVARQNGDAL